MTSQTGSDTFTWPRVPGARMDAPPWLAPHLRAGETVRWTHAPGPEAWRRVVVGVVLWGWLTFWVGFSKPSWWTFLPIWPETKVAPVVGALVAGLAFLLDAASTTLRARYTAYAVTDQRLLRVHLAHPLARVLPPPRPDAWPLAQARVVEQETRRGRTRVRILVASPAGRRLARFRLSVPDGAALVDALQPAAAARQAA